MHHDCIAELSALPSLSIKQTRVFLNFYLYFVFLYKCRFSEVLHVLGFYNTVHVLHNECDPMAMICKVWLCSLLRFIIIISRKVSLQYRDAKNYSHL